VIIPEIVSLVEGMQKDVVRVCVDFLMKNDLSVNNARDAKGLNLKKHFLRLWRCSRTGLLLDWV